MMPGAPVTPQIPAGAAGQITLFSIFHRAIQALAALLNFISILARIFAQGCRCILYSCGLHEEHVSDHTVDS